MLRRILSLAVALVAVPVTSLLLAAPAPPRPPAAEWPQFRGPKRDGVSAETGLLKEWPTNGPALLWQSEFVGAGVASVAVVGDRVFTTGDDKKAGASFVYALDRKTGKQVWSAKLGGEIGGKMAEGTRGTPTVDGEYVYALGQFGDLVCLEIQSGKEVWRRHLKKDFNGVAGPWQYAESLLVDGDKVICTPGGQKATMAALDRKTGAVVWEASIGDAAGYSSPVVAEFGGVRQYVQLLAKGVAAVSAKDGKLLWRYGTQMDRFGGSAANVTTPVVLGKELFCAAGYNRGGGLIKLSRLDNQEIKADEVYFKKELSNKHGGVVVVGDYAYGDQEETGMPQCFEWKTGNVVWKRQQRTQGTGSAAITYADGRLYVRYANGFVALVDADPKGKYEEKGNFKVPNSDKNSWSHLVVAAGCLYVREKETVYCYDVKAK
jgi:outer membrane protein assembly factor BamB